MSTAAIDNSYRPVLLVAKPASQPCRRFDCAETEARHQKRLTQSERPEERGHQIVDAFNVGREQSAIRTRVVRAQRIGSRINRPLHHDCRPIVERMREGCVGVDEREAVFGERKRTQEG